MWSSQWLRCCCSTRVGRRKLLITGTVRLWCGLLILAVYFTSADLQERAGYLAMAGLLIFIASSAIGLGPVFWLMISEISPIGLRSKAMAVCTIATWGANLVVAQTFLSLGNLITRQGVFYLYAGGHRILGILRRAGSRDPGRSLEEVQADLAGDNVGDPR